MRIYGQFNQIENRLYVSYHAFEPTLEEYKAYLEIQEDYFKKADTLYVFYHTSLSNYLSAENRAVRSKWINQNKDLVKTKVKMMVFISPSMAVRLALKIILALSPLPCPNQVVQCKDDADKLF